MARRLFRKKRPQQSRSLAVFLIAVLCLGVGYALWFTDSTRHRETAQMSAPVATETAQPVKLPSGFGDAFIDRPAMRFGNPVENDRRSEDSAAKPATGSEAAALPPAPTPSADASAPGSPQAQMEPISRGGAVRHEPVAEATGQVVAPAAPQPAASGSTTNGQSGEQIRSASPAPAAEPPSALPENPAAALAVEPAAGPAAPPSAELVTPTIIASLADSPTITPSSQPERDTETPLRIPRPVPRARQAAPAVEDDDLIDARTATPEPAPSPEDSLAIVAAPLQPVIVPPSYDEEPVAAQRERPARSVETNDDLPVANSRNVARSLVTTAIRNREPVKTLDETISLREVDGGQFHYFTELTGLMGRKVEHRWIYRGRVEGTMRFQVASNRWRASSRKTIQPHQKGEWQVVVVDEAGRTLGGSRFVVE